MTPHPQPSGMPPVVRVLVVPLLQLAWWMPTRWQRGERHTLAMRTTSDPSIQVREARAALAAFQAAERRSAAGRPTLRRQLRRAAHLPSMAAAAVEAGELDAAAAYAQQMLAAGIIPLEIEAPDAYLHPFVIFELGDDPLVTVETLSAELQVNDPQEVAVYRRTLERYRSAALWADKAVEALRAMSPTL
jgi:Domain of unknown function (DUF5753)